MSLTVDIQNASGDDEQPPAKDIQLWLDCTIRSANSNSTNNKQDDAELSVRIVDEAEILELNSNYRQKNSTTNVLSFPADLPDAVELPLLGDIVICAPVIKREANEQGKSLQAHWAHIMIHGCLHLLGYDHINDKDAAIMESLEIKILGELAFQNPYLVTTESNKKLA
jgi:probable rRNA maturation factor